MRPTLVRPWSTTATAIALACSLVVVTACGLASEDRRDATTAAGDPAPAPVPVGADEGRPPLPPGWRWEGFAGVVVGVPGGFGWGNGSQVLGQWCVDPPDRDAGEPAGPLVGRPGATTMVGCPVGGPGEPDPSTLVAETGVVVAFEWALPGAPGLPGDATVDVGGDQAVRRVGDVVVRVNAPADLRRRVLATVHTDGLDPLGCTARLPVAQGPRSRPAPPSDLAALAGVTSVRVCRYLLPDAVPVGAGEPGTLPLESSALLTGAEARAAVAGLAAGAPGGGPDDPTTCLPEVSHGDDFLLLHVEHQGGSAAVQVSYSGCDHNGVDDGTTLRALTPAVASLFTGAVELRGWSGRGKERILAPALRG